MCPWLRVGRALFGLAAALLAACGGSGGGAPVVAPFWVSGGLVVSDLDGDGRADVAVARTYVAQPPPPPGYVDVYLQTAPGRFVPPQPYPIAPDPWVLAAADIDGDGRDDLLAASPLTAPVAINAVGDSGAVSWLRQLAASPGHFDAAQVLATGGVANDVAASEVNGDGRRDLLVADGAVANSRALLMLQQPAAGAFAAPQPVCAGTGQGWSALAVGDLDGDGRPDLAGVGGGALWWCRGQAGGAFDAPAFIGSGVALVGLVLADLDADGRLDAVAADAGQAPAGGTGGAAVRWWRQTSPGVFTPQSLAVADGARRVAVRDLNQDGRPDIAVISTVYQTQANSTRIGVLLQSDTVAGAFSLTQAWQGPDGAGFIAVGDVTGDGRVDIVVDGPRLPAVGRGGGRVPARRRAALSARARRLTWVKGAAAALPRLTGIDNRCQEVP